MRVSFRLLAAVSAVALLSISAASAQLAVSANDGKAVINNGVAGVPDKPTPDNVTVIDLSKSPPKVIAEIKAPTSVVGPPSSVAINRDESLALVTAAMKLDPNDAKKTIPDNKVSVIDLKANPPAVISTVEAGAGAAGVAFNPAGTLALVANRSEGTVTVFKVEGKTLTATGKISLGNDKSGPSGVAFTPDGKMALVTRDGDSKVSVLAVDGLSVTDTKREMTPGQRPYPLDIASTGKVAVITNIGTGSGDMDTVSLIDIEAKPPRVVDTVTVGQTPEGMKISPNGKFVAVTAMNGSNKPTNSPFFRDHGSVVIFAIKGKKLDKVTESKVGHWCQGAAWSSDSKKLLVQCMVESELQVFSFNGSRLRRTGAVKVSGGPAGIGTAR